MSYLDLLGSLFEGNRKNVAAAGTFTNSPLVDYTRISPNKTVNRNHVIDTITIHCYVGQVSVENAGSWFAKTSAACSCNYVIGSDGRIGLIVEEKDRSWCSSSSSNDHRAITIECASDKAHPYAVNAAVYESLIDLCADICKRNNIKQLLWRGDKSLIGQVHLQNMTVHRWFANKACPGDYLYSRHDEIAAKVNAILNPNSGEKTQSSGALYCVQTGAFSKEQNAKNMELELKSKGFNTYIVQEDGLWKVQVGAYSLKMNATNMQNRLKSAGYNSIIAFKQDSGSTGTTTVVTPVPEPQPAAPRQTPLEVAQDIINGKGNWGVGGTRKTKLEAAGYSYNEVQGLVNQILQQGKATKEDNTRMTPTEVAKQIVSGNHSWGNGEARKKNLTAAGYNYDEVQAIVNQLIRGGSSSTPVSPSKPAKKSGQAVRLNKTKLYASSSSKSAAATKTGTYYLWDTRVLNGRIRITNRAANAGNASQITGWVNTSDIGL